MALYSARYTKEVEDLTVWVTERLQDLPPLVLTRDEYQAGVDALPHPYNSIPVQAFRIWLDEKKYELSYSQMCQAFFAAAEQSGRLTVN